MMFLIFPSLISHHIFIVVNSQRQAYHHLTSRHHHIHQRAYFLVFIQRHSSAQKQTHLLVLACTNSCQEEWSLVAWLFIKAKIIFNIKPKRISIRIIYKETHSIVVCLQRRRKLKNNDRQLIWRGPLSITPIHFGVVFFS